MSYVNDRIAKRRYAQANQRWLVTWIDVMGDEQQTYVRGGSTETHRRVTVQCGARFVSARKVDG